MIIYSVQLIRRSLTDSTSIEDQMEFVERNKGWMAGVTRIMLKTGTDTVKATCIKCCLYKTKHCCICQKRLAKRGIYMP